MEAELDIRDEASTRVQVWDLFTKGYSKAKIARILKISRQYAGRLVKEATKEILNDTMGTTAIEILTEELAKLAETESQISRDLALIDASKGELHFYNKEGELESIPASAIDAQKARLYKLKNEIIQHRLKILQDCGAMPKNPESMKKALDDYQVNEDEQAITEDAARTEEELDTDLETLLKHGLRME